MFVNKFSIIDDSGEKITELEIPSVIKLGNEEYTVKKFKEVIKGGGYTTSGVIYSFSQSAENLDITKVTIPSTIEEIGIGVSDDIFQYFKNLTDVNIEATDVNISRESFTSTPWLESVYANEENLNLFVHNGKIISVKDGATKVVIPSNVTSLPQGMFSSCTDLNEVENIPANISDVEVAEAFGRQNSSCPWFTTKVKRENGFVIYNDSVLMEITEISGTEITIPDDIKGIMYNVFNMNVFNAGNVSINIPGSVVTIEESAFGTYPHQGITITNITVAKDEGSISGVAPWGATNATVTWTGSTQTNP